MVPEKPTARATETTEAAIRRGRTRMSASASRPAAPDSRRSGRRRMKLGGGDQEGAEERHGDHRDEQRQQRVAGLLAGVHVLAERDDAQGHGAAQGDDAERDPDRVRPATLHGRLGQGLRRPDPARPPPGDEPGQLGDEHPGARGDEQHQRAGPQAGPGRDELLAGQAAQRERRQPHARAGRRSAPRGPRARPARRSSCAGAGRTRPRWPAAARTDGGAAAPTGTRRRPRRTWRRSP